MMHSQLTFVHISVKLELCGQRLIWVQFLCTGLNEAWCHGTGTVRGGRPPAVVEWPLLVDVTWKTHPPTPPPSSHGLQDTPTLTLLSRSTRHAHLHPPLTIYKTHPPSPSPSPSPSSHSLQDMPTTPSPSSHSLQDMPTLTLLSQSTTI